MDKWASDQSLNVLFLRIFSHSTQKPMSSLFSSLIPIGISTLGTTSMILKLRNYPPSSSCYSHFVYTPLGRIPPGGPPSSNGSFHVTSFFSVLSSHSLAPFPHHLVPHCPFQDPRLPLDSCLAWSSHPRPVSAVVPQFRCLHPYLLFCFANSESNDHLFLHCPFTWHH